MFKKIFVRIFGFLVIIVLLATSCNKSLVYTSTKPIAEASWHKDSIVSFKLPQLDTITKYHAYLNIRNTNNYLYSNLYLIAQLNYPNGKQQIDTLQYLMAKPNGEWLGVGATSVKESKLWYLQNFQFSENGNYSIDIKHAMRNNGDIEGLLYLKGILDIGVQIESTSQQR